MIIMRGLLLVGMIVASGVICASESQLPISESPTLKRQLSERILAGKAMFGGVLDKKRAAEQKAQQEDLKKQIETPSIPEISSIPEINETRPMLMAQPIDGQLTEQLNNTIAELQRKKQQLEELQQEKKKLEELMQQKELTMQVRTAEEQSLQQRLEASQTTHNSLQQELKKSNEECSLGKQTLEEELRQKKELEKLLLQAKLIIEQIGTNEASLKQQHESEMKKNISIHEDSILRYRVACMMFVSILLILVLDRCGIKIPIVSG